MSRDVVPIGQMHTRMPEQGRIRIGISSPGRNNSKVPKKLKFFRFSSQDEGAIRAIAELYGGKPAKWSDAPTAEQWEVYTTVNEVPIVLPPDPLGGTPLYEAWSSGGIQRRCDGVTMQVPRATPDGSEMCDEPCQCAANKRLACKVTTRLSVVLRDVRFGGSWRLESHGWYSAHELPGMVAMIEQLQGAGIVRGLLQLKEHTRVVQTARGPQTRKWMVPALAVDASVAELVAGSASLGALAPAPAPALPAGRDVPEDQAPALAAPVELDDGSAWTVDDDDVADAELVVEEEADVPSAVDPAEGAPSPEVETAAVVDGTEGGAMGGGGAAPPHETPPPLHPDAAELREKMMRRMHALVRDVRAQCDAAVSADDWRHGIVRTVTRGAKESSSELTDDELRAVLDLLDDLKEGRRRFLNYEPTMRRIMLSGRKA